MHTLDHSVAVYHHMVETFYCLSASKCFTGSVQLPTRWQKLTNDDESWVKDVKRQAKTSERRLKS